MVTSLTATYVVVGIPHHVETPKSTQNFTPGDVQAYAGLLDAVRALEKAKVTECLAEAQQQQTSLLAAVEQEQDARQKLSGAIKVTLEKLADYQDGFFINLIMDDKEKSRKLEKHSKLLEQAQEDLAACDKRLAALATQIQQCKARVASLGGQVVELQSLQEQAAAQLLQLFSSPGWQCDPGYQGLQQACKQHDAEAAAAVRTVSACRQAKPLLERASEKLRSALDALDWVVTKTNRWHNAGAGMHHTAMHHTAMHNGAMHQAAVHHHAMHHTQGDCSRGAAYLLMCDAHRRVKKAAQAVMEARTHLSRVPDITVACIDPDRCMGGPVMVSGFYERRLVLGEAQEATRQISNMLSQVNDCHFWVISTLAAAEEQYTVAEAARGQKTAELDSFRLRMAQEAVMALRQEGQLEVQDYPNAPAVPNIVEGIPVM